MNPKARFAGAGCFCSLGMFVIIFMSSSNLFQFPYGFVFGIAFCIIGMGFAGLFGALKRGFTNYENQRRHHILQSRESLTKSSFPFLLKLFQNERKVKLDSVAKMLHTTRERIIEALVDWKSELPEFTLDGDVIIVNPESINAFIFQLNAMFEDWQSSEGNVARNTKDRNRMWALKAREYMASQKWDTAIIMWKLVRKVAIDNGWTQESKDADNNLKLCGDQKEFNESKSG